jgi:hypothetical protein
VRTGLDGIVERPRVSDNSQSHGQSLSQRHSFGTSQPCFAFALGSSLMRTSSQAQPRERLTAWITELMYPNWYAHDCLTLVRGFVCDHGKPHTAHSTPTSAPPHTNQHIILDALGNAPCHQWGRSSPGHPCGEAHGRASACTRSRHRTESPPAQTCRRRLRLARPTHSTQITLSLHGMSGDARSSQDASRHDRHRQR